ncbi:hypothetical protein CONPUDRAFT_160357 [Coniophora puteana RWD-64-598 SS2]|uniref:Uncharacterized protein n=1 Tax=Coniophora puteana (strain RWD-64-598) TaxID=741705 RepID=R7SE09_CONPW|nr:uncharacterized protein CONPUDRAFT_160357 [Coniophora puteana RWD-64-598 SS2]EIW74100.1 hypothetical protein CONPUDRAFT_160357 [Coniophora puteana RWD-64-598 SS2]
MDDRPFHLRQRGPIQWASWRPIGAHRESVDANNYYTLLTNDGVIMLSWPRESVDANNYFNEDDLYEEA